jgi:hypothetical protein
MTSEQLRKNVWEEMLYSQMRSQYFAELVRVYASRDKWLRVLVLAASSGAVAMAFTSTQYRFIPPIFAALGSFWLLLSGYPGLQREAAELHAGWEEQSTAYEKLFGRLDSPNAEDEFHNIYSRGNKLSSQGTKFPNKKERLDHWLTQAAELAMSRYA